MDIEWTRINSRKLSLYSSLAFSSMALTLIIFSKYIVMIIFGSQYEDSVQVFRILVIAFFFQASFRMIYGNLLVAQRKLKFNVIESVLSGIVNIVGDYMLITRYQEIGVALSTLFVMIFSSVLSGTYYFYVLKKKQAQKV